MEVLVEIGKVVLLLIYGVPLLAVGLAAAYISSHERD